MLTSGPYFERYCNGEHVAVYRELIGLGPQIREEPILSDALAVAHEIVRRARGNLRILHRRLLDMGYEFEDPHNALVDAGAEAIETVRTSQAKLGTFPLLLQVWYENIASVDFTQAESQLRISDQGTLNVPDFFGLGSHPVLVFRRIDNCWETWQKSRDEFIKSNSELIEFYGEDGFSLDDFVPYLTFGGVASNCDSKGIQVPADRFDGVLYDDGGGDVYFLDELRLAFEWGGFPFWRDRTHGLPCDYRPNFKKLIPILKEGLLAL